MSSFPPFSVAFAIDDGYVKPLQVAMISLYANAHIETIYNVYVVNYRLKATTRQQIEQTQQRHHPQGKIHFLDISDVQWAGIPQVGEWWGKAAACRLLLADLLPNMSSILYLDADVMVLDDLSDMHKISLEGKAFAGVFEERWMFEKKSRILALAHFDGHELKEFYYCNSGVLYLNLNYWREHNFTNEAFRLMGLVGKLPGFCPDQEVINYLTLRDGGLDAIEKLGFEYNYDPRTLALEYNNGDEVVDFFYRMQDQLFLDATHFAIADDAQNALHKAGVFKPRIVHFVACAPWAIRNAEVPFRDKYQEYASKIGWKMPDSIFYRGHFKDLIIKVRKRPSYFILLSVIIGLSVGFGVLIGMQF